MKNLLMIFPLLFAFQISNATNYHVSPNRNSSSKGTKENPWTVQHVAGQAFAGRKVYFLLGTYDFTGLIINRSESFNFKLPANLYQHPGKLLIN